MMDQEAAPPCAEVTILLGSEAIRCSEHLAMLVGWTCYSGTDIAHWTDRGDERVHTAALGQALLEGLTGDRAALRALVLIGERKAARDIGAVNHAIALETSKAAGMHLAAEREMSRRVGK